MGLRFDSARWQLSGALFGARYDDFIESRVDLGADPDTGTLIFQSQNIAKAQVYGAEFKLAADLDAWLQGLSLSVAANWTRGENQQDGTPLNSVDPPEAVIRVAWAPRATMRFSLMTTLVDEQNRIDESSGDLWSMRWRRLSRCAICASTSACPIFWMRRIGSGPPCAIAPRTTP